MALIVHLQIALISPQHRIKVIAFPSMNIISRMKRNIVMQDPNPTSPLVKRPRTRQCSRTATMFFRFPREIRDSIYGYVLESPLTPLDSVQAKFNQSTLLTTGLLKASKQCHEEAMEYMCDEVEVKIYAGLDWEERAKMLLRTCRHITIVWDPLRRTVEVS